MGFVDFDHDGHFDLYQANGRVMMQGGDFTSDPYAEPNLLMRGDASGRFEVLGGGTSSPLYATSRAAAFGDVDGDGAIDVLVVNRDAPAHLLRNTVPDRGAWVMLRVVNQHGADALGAVVRFRVGDRAWLYDVRAGYSYLASNDPRVHVGLGESDRIDEVTVEWPDGSFESFGALEAGRVHELRRGASDGG